MIRLDEKYNRDDFIAFLSNVFFADFTRDIRPIHTQNLSAIEKAYSLGKSDKLDLQIFEFEYAGSSKKRITLTKEAFRIMQDSASYQALAIFHGKENDDWRLSLMILNPKKTDSGKVSLSYSNPRRYSYFLGPNAKINTPHRFLIKTGQVKDFDDLQSRFNVEIVTKEFFENYKKLFDRLLAYLQKDHAFQAFANNNGINTANFAKKLLGQIVFLYFLQRKGWLGAKKGDSVSQGNKNFIRALFNQSRDKGVNFYNTYLEPLFYGALNKPAEKAASYYRDYFDSQIPFLNGGLFEPPQNYDWEKSFLHIPDKVFSKDPKNPEHGDGILDIFDMYNFTVDESDFLDKEVSVDPEMLGKVFENLLEENLRKGKGTYYTPREIVNYMCEESLVNFLATETNLAPDDVKNKYFPAYNILGDEKIETRDVTTSEQIIESLKGIKVVDPACGSGAFLVGMLQQIMHLRHELEVRSKILGRRTTISSEYEIKKETIQNCIYGVDIDPGAIEIAKLRLWLSLVVEYELEEIEPLPNLDYKIMQGNSLLEELVLGDTTIKLYDPKLIQKTNNSKKMQTLFEVDTRIGLFDDEKEQVIKTMKMLQLEYFKASDGGEKKRLKSLIDKVEHNLIETSVKSTAKELQNQKINIKALPGIGLLDKDVKKLEKISNIESQIFAVLDELKRTGTKPFFLWHLYFADVFEEKAGFDVIIANPPYLGESGNKDTFRPIARGNLGRFYQGKMDLFYFFFHLALDLGKPNSTCTLISTNYFITAFGAKKLRQDLKDRAVINNLINFNELKIFESALGQHNMITIFNKGQNDKSVAHTCITHRTGMANEEILKEIVSNVDYDTKYFSVKQNQLYDGEESYIRLGGIGNTEDPVDKVLEKIKQQGNILKNVCEINQGLVTGANKVSLRHINKYNLKANIGDGIFILSKEEIKNLNLSENEKQILKPWFKNSDVHRWDTNNSTNEYLILADKRLHNLEGNSVKNHLLIFKKVLDDSTDNSPYLHRPRDINLDEAKIVAPYRSKTNTFGYNEIPWYAASDIYFITQKDKLFSLKFILGLLNSKLYHLWLSERGKKKGEILELFYKPLSEIPIKKISKDEQKPLIEIVDKILTLTRSGDYLSNTEKQTRVKDYEKLIDQIIYKLYDLTPEEIKIVEDD